MRTKHAVERYVDVVSLIRKAPRKTSELCKLAELSPCAVRRLTKAMEGEGLITACRKEGHAFVWEWRA